MPTNDDMRAILADLSAAQRALRSSNDAFKTAMAQVLALTATIDAAATAQGEAIDAVIAATDKGLAAVDAGRHQ